MIHVKNRSRAIVYLQFQSSGVSSRTAITAKAVPEQQFMKLDFEGVMGHSDHTLRKLSIIIMLLVWVFTSTILMWGLTGKVDLPTLILLFILPYIIWMLIEVARRKLG